MKICMVGGAGFIGFHAARYFAEKGHEIVIIDDFSRKGGEEHTNLLTQAFADKISIVKCDISDPWSEIGEKLTNLFDSSDGVLHLAAQVAVTTSVSDPRRDFEINALGTFNLLEAVRHTTKKPPFVYSSTNKVYGGMEDEEVIERDNRYYFAQLPYGVSESQPMDFHSPYGCSKGAADQYVRDYSRIYDIPAVVLRQSCIYGTHQFGHEDQGWIAHLCLNAFREKPLTIFGDGKQVRDVLYAEDLVKLYEKCFENPDKISGKIYNTGGGHKNLLSLLDLVSELETQLDRKLDVNYDDWRPGDQKVFICDIQKLKDDLDWQPEISPSEGVAKFLAWANENREEIERVLSA